MGVLVQLMIDPGIVGVEKIIGSTHEPLQRTKDETKSNSGAAFTVKEKLMGVPEQALETGVTTTRAVISVMMGLVYVKLVMLPTPDVAKPIAGLSLVQLKMVPETLPVKLIAPEV